MLATIGMSLIENTEKSAAIAETLKAVAHPIRLRIIAVLCAGEEHVGGLASKLGVSQPIISQQLRILRDKNLVRVKRSEGLAVYELAEPRLVQIVHCMEECERF